MRKIALLAAIAAFLPTSASATDCTPSFVMETDSVVINAETFGPRDVAQSSFEIRLQNEGDTSCETQIRITRIEGTADPAELEYTIRSGATEINIQASAGAPTNSQGNLLIQQIPSEAQSFPINFLLTIPTDWGIAAGNYEEQLQMQLLDQDGRVIDTLFFNIVAYVPSAAEIRIVGAAGSGAVATVDLGQIDSRTASRSDPIAIRVFSTSAYVLTFESESNGRMVHENTVDTIPYRMDMDGGTVDLSTTTEFTFTRRTPRIGEIYNLQFSAGPVRARAGDYKDRVTVTITAV